MNMNEWSLADKGAAYLLQSAGTVCKFPNDYNCILMLFQILTVSF